MPINVDTTWAEWHFFRRKLFLYYQVKEEKNSLRSFFLIKSHPLGDFFCSLAIVFHRTMYA